MKQRTGTPICDFVRAYAAENPVRMHMPGHKGKPELGPEALDLTEIAGADVLYHAGGIIRQSEENAAELFGASRTVYSAEGSSLCIRAMLYLAMVTAVKAGKPRRLLAGRNAHRTLMTAAALLDLEIDWLQPAAGEDLLGCSIAPEMLEQKLKEQPYMAVFVTSPDYLGRRADISALAAVCRKYGVPLLADNAHGAYLRFLTPDEHPLTLGAAASCDSAHKTLKCLTGAAYLHISPHAPANWQEQAEQAMDMFASTSPSYLILQSLDLMNAELADGYPARLRKAAERVGNMKTTLEKEGWKLIADEPMKLTLDAAARGYSGAELQSLLRRRGIECEFADQEYLVLMPSAETTGNDWERLRAALNEVPQRTPIDICPPIYPEPERVCSIREAMLSPSVEMPAEKAVGRVMADASVGCPPAVPPVIAGEKITEAVAACMRYYGVTRCRVTENRPEHAGR